MTTYKKKVIVIGAGFSGLAAAGSLSRAGYQVEVHEKNAQIGGRARVLKEGGFVFDMGPSWYWMPDVAENFFNSFGKSAADFYELKKISPSFRIFFGEQDYWDVPSEPDELFDFFEKHEAGASVQLKKFMEQAAYKYYIAMKKLIYQPSLSWMEYLQWPLIKGLIKYPLFTSFQKHVRSYFKNPRLVSLMEFPVLFLGSSPKKIPALYSLMNYSGLMQGTWYPKGGMYGMIEALRQIVVEHGSSIHTSSEVTGMSVHNSSITNCLTNDGSHECEAVIASADYQHIDQQVLEKPYRSYSEAYWNTRAMAPSCLIFYLGINKKLSNLSHHNLFFDEDADQHTSEIYTHPKWPGRPLFYVCCPSKTDDLVAPAGCENIFILMPIAAGLEDSPEQRERYYELLLGRMEKLTGESIISNVIYKKSYSLNDFKQDYHAFKGNAFGMANTLFQTAIFKPSMKSKKIRNLFFAGQLTVPGPGVPPAIISGQIAATQVAKFLN